MKNASGQPAAACKVKMSGRREPFIRAVLVLGKTCSYKWYSSRLIFPRINGPIYSIKILIVQNNGKETYKKCAARAIKCFC